MATISIKTPTKGSTINQALTLGPASSSRLITPINMKIIPIFDYNITKDSPVIRIINNGLIFQSLCSE